MVLLLRSAIDARHLNILEFNLAVDLLPNLVAHLPSLRSPTVSPLQGGGVAVKIAVRRDVLPALVAVIKQYGGTDLLVTAVNQTIA
jgi:ATP phosphoribosyltransferase